MNSGDLYQSAVGPISVCKSARNRDALIDAAIVIHILRVIYNYDAVSWNIN